MGSRSLSPAFARVAALVLSLACAASASADTAVRLVTAPGTPIHVDGWLTEWRASPLTDIGSDALRYALASSSEGLLVALQVRDDRVVRTDRPTAQTDDAVVVSFASPAASGLVATEIYIHPGVEGQRGAVVHAGAPGESPRPVQGARVVEASTRDGYELEAIIPWSSIPGAADLMRARARVRLSDVDGGGPRVTGTSDAADPARWPFLTGEVGELGTLARFLRERRLERSAVTVDLRGDVTHDGRAERIVVAGGFVAVFGESYLGGRGYDFLALGTLSRRGVIEAKLVDFEGDGRLELFVVLEIEERGARRTIARVLDFDASRIAPLFELEAGYADARGEVTTELVIEPARGGEPAGIRIRPGAARGLDARTLPVPSAPLLAMPTPWSGVTARVYRFGDGRFRMVSEDRVEQPSQPTTTQPVATRPQNPPPRTTNPPPRAPTPTPAQPAQRAWSADPLLASFRAERRLGNVAPSSTQSGDVAGDARPEQVVLLGKSLVVVGPGFLDGARYYAIDLDVADPTHVLGVELFDVTNDAQSEIVVRLKKPAGATQAFEMLVVYRLTSAGMQRLLVAQVGFTDGARAIRNEARATGSGRARRFVIAPGRATGWEASTWPFADTGASGGIAPLLLPWRDRDVRYRFDGQALVRE